jgi:oligopeptide/dipeptide ABC transporter ATP-binding protein
MSDAPGPAPRAESAPLVEVEHLVKHFPTRGGWGARKKPEVVRAVDDVSFTIRRGETLGLVGESGSGKTTVGRALLRLIEPTSGRVRFDGTELGALSPEALRRLRPRMQIIFQDPYASLNPRLTIGEAIAEPIRVHGIAKGPEIERSVASLLDRVGLPASARDRYPHEFSGGQRQRICIARALSVKPSFIVCDEAVSALDLSIQAQVLNLLRDLSDDLGLTYLFITHNLNVLRSIADRVLVMYLGQVVESAPVEQLLSAPGHPYTRALLSANPLPDPLAPFDPVSLEGEIPSAVSPPSGCRFHTRCPEAFEPCPTLVPSDRLVNRKPPHRVLCHLAEDAA